MRTKASIVVYTIIMGLLLLLSNSCDKDYINPEKENPKSGATITTIEVTAIGQTTAVSGGNVTNDGGSLVIARGVCWSTSETPTISDNKTTDGTGPGIFISNIPNLDAGTTYHVRSYATNSIDTSYGNTYSFKTLGQTAIPSGRTLLVYLAGNNNLSPEVRDLHAALMEGWNPKTMGSLVIFADSRNDGSPMLIKFREQNNKTVADTLRRYKDKSSASPELFSQVIDDTRLLAPGESYGMMLFSHATGWLPEKAYLNPVKWAAVSDEGPRIVSRSIFDDKGREMELADFVTAIPDGMFEFIASEMCFMSGVEIAFALRNKTAYLLASAPEVLSPGFAPIYKTSLGLLYKPEPDLQGFAQSFFDYFNGLQGAFKSAAISVVRTSEMESLAALTREIAAPLINQEQINQIQHYDGNNRFGMPHLFFDFGDYISRVASPKQIEEMEVLLSKAVIFKLNTPKLINVTIAKHSGLSVYIPQEKLPNLNNAYKETEWWKATNN